MYSVFWDEEPSIIVHSNTALGSSLLLSSIEIFPLMDALPKIVREM